MRIEGKHSSQGSGQKIVSTIAETTHTYNQCERERHVLRDVLGICD
jgi:hypothetical protein